MSVGLLIVTHRGVGTQLLAVATEILGDCPLRTAILEINPNDDCNQARHRVQQLAAELNRGDGLLALTDLFGSTPSNIANSLHGCCDLRIVAGVNLPMLVRILNYPTLKLQELTEKACSGGQDGILLCSPTQNEASLQR